MMDLSVTTSDLGIQIASALTILFFGGCLRSRWLCFRQSSYPQTEKVGASSHFPFGNAMSEHDPLFSRTYAASSTTSTSTGVARCYGGFEQQKRTWASTARRSQRIRVIAGLQLVLGVLASCNYLWLSNIFMFVVGIVGLLAVRSERMSWTVVVRLYVG